MTERAQMAISKVRNPTLTGVVVLIVSLAVIIIASQLLYERTVDLLTENLRERILTISITAAASIDADDLAVLRVESDWMRPEWARVVGRMHEAKYSNRNVVFMYIFRKQAGDPTAMEFVADADSADPYANTDEDPNNDVDVNRDGIIESDGPDKLQWPGQPYPEAVDIPEAWAAYENPLTSADLYTDSYGTVLTGYAPIKDAAGNTVAVLATDVKADDFFMITTQTLQPFLAFILFLTLVIIFLTVVIFLSWKSYADSFQQMNTRLQELDRLKSQFLSFASHQLRAPLNAIKWQSEILLDGTLGVLPSEARETVAQIDTSAAGLSTLVNEFLDLRNLEEGRMEFSFERTALDELVRTTVGSLQPLAERKGLKLVHETSDTKLYASVDRAKFKQVIQNLVENSIKYTDEGSVSVRITDDGEGHAVISVTDTGHGLTPDLIPTLFDEFMRARSDARRIEGTGLGLYIAKQIMLAHKGDVWAESAGPGKGSVFCIRIALLRP